MKKQKPEEFNNYLTRLFSYDDDTNLIGVKGNHAYSITFQVTEACNLACSYCYQHNKTPMDMDFNTAKNFIDILLTPDERSLKYINSYATKGATIEFIGGEPLLKIDLIDQISDYFIEQLFILNHPWLHRFRFNISTNGTLFFEQSVQNYIKKYKNFLSLNITIDGNKALHDACRLFPDGTGSYDIVHKAVTEWRKFQTIDQTKITISPYNVDKVSEALIFFIQEENYHTIFINCVYEEGWKDSDGKILYQQLKQVVDFLIENKLYDSTYITILDDIQPQTTSCLLAPESPFCGGSGSMICLDPHGDIYPCLRYAPSSIGYDKAQKMKIGNIKDGFIYNKHQEEILQQFSCVNRTSQLSSHPECISCPISHQCGDCAAYSYEKSGQIGYRTNYHCITHVARTLASCYYKSKTYLLNKSSIPFLNITPKDLALRIISEDEYKNITELAEEAFKQYARDNKL